MLINHTTSYRYSEPQRMIIQSHRLWPAACDSQKIINWEVHCEDALFGSYFLDGGGDQIRTMCVENLERDVEIRVTGEIETSDTNGLIKLRNERVSPLVYLRDTELTRPDDRIAELAKRALDLSGENQLDVAHGIMSEVSGAFKYIPGATDSSYTASQALEQGTGVCQDFAHCLIAAARLNRIPARYTTGYLHMDASGEQHDASHAWAELLIEGLGWVGFDATNDCCPDARYVRVGSGLDAQDAALIRGISRGVGEETMHTDVNIVNAQQ
nr:transglutaminase family protein [Arenicella xantha]